MDGHIPVLFVKGTSLAEAWENSLIELHRQGCDIVTEYDKPGDPPSKDCSIMFTAPITKSLRDDL
jgi:thymidylate synthase